MKIRTIFSMLGMALLLVAGLTSCKQDIEYKVYENDQLPYIFEVPTTWTMDDSHPNCVKFLNADQSMGISCEVGIDALAKEEELDSFYEWELNKHKHEINNEQDVEKTFDHYILKWKDADGDYYIEGEKCVNGYLGCICMGSDSTNLSQATEIFQHVFESIAPNPHFLAPEDVEDEEK